MSADDLVENVYAHFKDAYGRFAPDASGGEIVAFEAIGFSPGCSSLSGNNASAAALETVSQFTDELPQVTGGAYVHTMRTISGTYGAMLDAAQATSAASLVTFAALKSQAREAFDAVLGSYDGPTSYHPTYPTPADWYDLTNAGNWTSYSYDSSVPAAPPPPAPAAPNVHIQWHVLPLELRPRVNPLPERIGLHPMLEVERPMFSRTSSPVVETAAPLLVAHAATSVPAAQLIRPTAFTAVSAAANLAQQTQTQPVQTPVFTMSFDYCLVQLRRPWFSGDLLATPGWFVPGAHAGDYAAGSPRTSGAFAVVPRAFIAIKNLLISGAWSGDDAAASAGAAAFGPFALAGGSTNKTGMGNPGLQIIAWVCAVQPQLPPDSDPALPAVAAAQNAPTPVQVAGSSVA